MRVTDPIADMLTRIRNASMAKLKYVSIPASRLKVDIARVLEAEGFVHGFRLLRDNGQGKIKIALKYTATNDPVIRGLKRASRPGLRLYCGVSDLPRVRNGMGTAVLTTPKGVFPVRKARLEKVGGEVLFYVW
jgi:small subunit ribosomal protein S8